MKQKPCIFTGECQFGKLTIEVLRGDGQYIKHEAKAYCTIFGKRYEETVYDDDVNVAIREAGNKLINKLKSKFNV